MLIHMGAALPLPFATMLQGYRTAFFACFGNAASITSKRLFTYRTILNLIYETTAKLM